MVEANKCTLDYMRENEALLINELKKSIDNDYIEVHDDYSIYGYLKNIKIIASTSIEENMKGLLHGKDDFGRNRYELLRINWKPLGKYLDKIQIEPNIYTKKSNGDLFFNIDEMFFEWDEINKFELYDLPCQHNIINIDTVNKIVNYIKKAIDNYQI